MQPTHAERDADWFDDLVTAYQSKVLAFLRSRLPGTAKETANDLAQETFMTAWLKRVVVPDEPATWLFATATNHLRNYQRRQHIRRLSHEELTDDALTEPDPSDSIDGRVDIAAAVRSLNSNDRMLLRMRYVDELALDEIATCLSVSPAAARKRLSHASQRLRQRLAISPDRLPSAMPDADAAPAERGFPTDIDIIERMARHTQHDRIRQFLETQYGRSDQPHRQNNLSATLAAFVAETLSCRRQTVALPQDSGIDAVWWDPESRTLHIVQAKWIHPDDSLREYDLIDAAVKLKRAILGPNDLLHEFLGHRGSPNQVHVILAISTAATRAALDNLSSSYRAELEGSQVATNIALFDSSNVYEFLPKPTEPACVMNLAMDAKSWQVSESLCTLLCIVSGEQIATWPSDLLGEKPHKQSGNSWRAELMLRHEPSRFWYLNHGLTINAHMIHFDAASPARITLERASLVNGSHTFMAIRNMASTDPDSAAQAQVLVRIVLQTVHEAAISNTKRITSDGAMAMAPVGQAVPAALGDCDSLGVQVGMRQ